MVQFFKKISFTTLVIFQDNPSQRTFIYDFLENSWTEGPLLLTPRYYHSSCAVQLDDGSTQCIIVIGGPEYWPGSTEIYDIKNGKWVIGPPLPYGERYASCGPLPPTSKYACLAIGRDINDFNFSWNVYGLNRILTGWTLLGKTKKGSKSYIALAPS